MDFGTLYIVLFAFVACAMNVIDAKDYYEILGVSRSATDRQIKKAFHKLAAKYHPDKNKEIGAEDQFREIAQAYEILSNSENRKKYDKYGDAAFNGGGRGGHHFNNFNFNDFFKHFDDFGGGGEEGGSRFGNDRNGFKFSFGGNGGGGGMFDDFFDGDDDWSDFDSFGNQDTFFGHFGHHHSHHSSHHSGHSESGVYRSSESRSHAEGGRTCKTVTQRVGNMVTTYTQCS